MIYETRKIDANRRIENLRKSLAESLPSVGAESRHPDLAIYATGSLARHEASENSDLDAFFMLSGAESKSPNGKIGLNLDLISETRGLQIDDIRRMPEEQRLEVAMKALEMSQTFYNL